MYTLHFFFFFANAGSTQKFLVQGWNPRDIAAIGAIVVRMLGSIAGPGIFVCCGGSQKRYVLRFLSVMGNVSIFLYSCILHI